MIGTRRARFAVYIWCLLAALSAATFAETIIERPKPWPPRSTRVFYLNGMSTREASTMLRSELEVRLLSTLPDRNMILLFDSVERLDLAETLLRDRGAVERAVDPHKPLEMLRPSHPVETRLFRFKGLDSRDASVLLRSVYTIAGQLFTPDGVLAISVPRERLDAIEATFNELGALAEPSSETGRTWNATKSGMLYTVVQNGSGAAAREGQTVKMHEVLTVGHRKEFSSTRDGEPVRLRLGANETIAGVDEALIGMRVGEIRRLIVPRALSARSEYPEGIWPSSLLHYELELVAIDR